MTAQIRVAPLDDGATTLNSLDPDLTGIESLSADFSTDGRQNVPTPSLRDRRLAKPDAYGKARRWVMYATELTNGAKVLYAVLDDFQGTNSDCFAHGPNLADILGCDERTVRRYVAELEQFGALDVVRHRGKANRYTIRSKDTNVRTSGTNVLTDRTPMSVGKDTNVLRIRPSQTTDKTPPTNSDDADYQRKRKRHPEQAAEADRIAAKNANTNREGYARTVFEGLIADIRPQPPVYSAPFTPAEVEEWLGAGKEPPGGFPPGTPLPDGYTNPTQPIDFSDIIESF